MTSLIVKKIITLVVIVSVIASLSIALLVYGIRSTVAPYVYTRDADIPEHRVAIIFGAGVRRDGSLSPILLDRVLAGVELLKDGTVAKLLMTGDNGSADYDEVSAMKKTAVAAGALPDQVILDYAGFNTYSSCYRAREIFGVESAILVTQKFHLPRALYLCRSLGIDADGLGLEDFEKYPNLQSSYTLREYAATYKAWLDVTFFKPKPKFLGKFEGPI